MGPKTEQAVRLASEVLHHLYDTGHVRISIDGPGSFEDWCDGVLMSTWALAHERSGDPALAELMVIEVSKIIGKAILADRWEETGGHLRVV